LEIALRGLQAHQKSLEVTGHNIANANTPGYSRQEAVHTAAAPYPPPGANSGTAPGQQGAGVDIDYIRRIRNEYLDTQVRDSTSAQSYWENKTEIMEQIESIFPEPDGRGIQEVMLNFFSDWQDLNNTPQDDGIKSAVVESAKELAKLFRDTHGQLQNVSESITGSDSGVIQKGKIFDQVNRVTELSNQISNITDSIKQVQREGRQPNDLLDKRDLLLNELAEFGPIKVSGSSDGGIKVTMFDGALTLVEPGLKISEIKAEISGNQITLETIKNNTPYQKINLTNISDTSKGSLLGTIAAWQENKEFINDINNLANNLGKHVNSAYKDHFFVNAGDTALDGTNGGAGDIYVEAGIKENPSQVDGTRALDVARLRNETLPGLDDSTLEGYYQGYIGVIGSRTQSAQNMQENQQAILDQIKNLQESTSGVSLDEELSRLIELQFGYQASARVMNVIDGVLDTLINRMAV
jgi:flagellar hook-associated protein 1 FlgK